MRERWHKEVIITPEQQAKYSDAALAVMKKHGVEINDLYSLILPNLEKFSTAPDNVHFNGAGSKQLVGQVVATLEKAITALENKKK